MTRRPIQATIRGTGGGWNDDDGGVRDAFARWPAGVALLAVRDEDDELEVLTVSAVTPVSVDPPLLLVCVGVHAGILPMLRDAGRFTVNVLAEDDRRAAAIAAERMPPDASRFADGDPVMAGAVASFVCALDAEHEGGDHAILVGRIEHVALGPDAPPLVHAARAYRGLRPGPL